VAAGTVDRDGRAAGVADAVADLPTGPVFYRDSGGSGIPVVFLHASSGNSMTWEHQIPAFLAAGYRFVAIDYRGVGGKSGPLDWSDQIEALVNRIGVDRFHLVGTALGGGTAFQYVLAYPQRVGSVVVANSHGNVTDRDYV
jgi:pimeloyl-ACP methyl ester carboxylesterase